MRVMAHTQASICAVSVLSLAMLSGCAVSPREVPPAPSNKAADKAVEVAIPPTASNVVTTAVPSAAVSIPAEAQQKFDQAIMLLKNGQTPAATTQLQQLAKAYPTFAAPIINLGLIELKAGRYQTASENFQQALNRDVKSPVASNYLGVAYRNLGRFKEAEAAYKAAIASDDAYPAAHLNLGILYDLYLQQAESALVEYQRYQGLLTAPDPKVAGWIKEVTSRVNADKKAKLVASETSP